MKLRPSIELLKPEARPISRWNREQRLVKLIHDIEDFQTIVWDRLTSDVPSDKRVRSIALRNLSRAVADLKTTYRRPIKEEK